MLRDRILVERLGTSLGRLLVLTIPFLPILTRPDGSNAVPFSRATVNVERAAMGKGVRLSGGYVDLGTVPKLNPYAFKHKDTQPKPAKKKKRKPRRKKSGKKTSGTAKRAKQPSQANGNPSPPAYWSSTAGGHPMGAVPKSAMKCSNCANLGFPCCAHGGFQICSNWAGKRKRSQSQRKPPR